MNRRRDEQDLACPVSSATTGPQPQLKIPVIETSRLLFRAFNERDLDAWAAVMSDPMVMKYLGGAPLAREETWRRLLAATGSWPALGFGYWAVVRKREGDLIGQVGFADFKRELTPSISGMPEMGWIFASHAQGQGYAAEAVIRALEWIDSHVAPETVPAIISAENAPSIRLAERCGFSEREEAIYRGSPISLFHRRVGAPRG